MRGIGRERGGLYILKNEFRGDLEKFVKGITKFASAATTQGDVKDRTLWHRRLGHISVNTMKNMNFFHNKTVDVVLNNDCPVCPLAKQNKLVFPRSLTRSENSLSLFHMDVWGPCKFPINDRKYFFLTIVNNNLMYTWVHLLQLNSDIDVVVRKFLSMFQTQFQSRV